MGTKFCRNTNFCRGLPDLKNVIIFVHFAYFYFLRPARNCNWQCNWYCLGNQQLHCTCFYALSGCRTILELFDFETKLSPMGASQQCPYGSYALPHRVMCYSPGQPEAACAAAAAAGNSAQWLPPSPSSQSYVLLSRTARSSVCNCCCSRQFSPWIPLVRVMVKKNINQDFFRSNRPIKVLQSVDEIFHPKQACDWQTYTIHSNIYTLFLHYRISPIL